MSKFEQLIKELNTKKIGSWICRDIKKRVYFTAALKSYNSEPIDEWGIIIDINKIEEKNIGYGDGFTRNELRFFKGFEPTD